MAEKLIKEWNTSWDGGPDAIVPLMKAELIPGPDGGLQIQMMKPKSRSEANCLVEAVGSLLAGLVEYCYDLKAPCEHPTCVAASVSAQAISMLAETRPDIYEVLRFQMEKAAKGEVLH